MVYRSMVNTNVLLWTDKLWTIKPWTMDYQTIDHGLNNSLISMRIVSPHCFLIFDHKGLVSYPRFIVQL